MNLQRIHIKILTDAPATLNLEPFLAIFGRWRGDKGHPAGWVDLADYAHVPRGAGVVLVGFNANFAFDMADPAPGVLYATKRGLTGTHAERIALTLRSCVELSRRLIAEPEFPKNVHLCLDVFELHFPDRLDTPNNQGTDQELRPAVAGVFDHVFGGSGYDIVPQADQKQAFGYSTRAKKPVPLDALLNRLA
jgi:hypothetical protein